MLSSSPIPSIILLVIIALCCVYKYRVDTWWTRAINLKAARKMVKPVAPVTVVVIDTGVDASVLKSSSEVQESRCFPQGEPPQRGAQYARCCGGHGNLMAKCIRRVSVKVAVFATNKRARSWFAF